MSIAAVAVCLAGSAVATPQTCPRADALGVARILAVDPREHRRIGLMHYAETLPLADKEVVLTFDDGPLPAYTARVLESLEAECVKATFFMVGRMARAYPEWVRRVYNAGHTVATHTQRHRRFFDQLPIETIAVEIEEGIAAAEAALGDPKALAPFFRFPGLRTSPRAERYLAERGIMTWSADVPSDDWREIAAETMIARTLARLEAKGRGVILMHDIQPRTVLALPELLRKLKARGFRVVHVVPSGIGRPKTVAEPELRVLRPQGKPIWPLVLAGRMRAKTPELSAPSALSFGFPDPFAATIEIASAFAAGPALALETNILPRPGGASAGQEPAWPMVQAPASNPTSQADLSAPSAQAVATLKPEATPPLTTISRPEVPQAAVTERMPARATPLRRARSKAIASRRRRPALGNEEISGWAMRLNWFH